MDMSLYVDTQERGARLHSWQTGLFLVVVLLLRGGALFLTLLLSGERIPAILRVARAGPPTPSQVTASSQAGRHRDRGWSALRLGSCPSVSLEYSNYRLRGLPYRSGPIPSGRS